MSTKSTAQFLSNSCLKMDLKNRSFRYGKVALAVRTQYHQLQFMLKVVAICTDTCMSLVQTIHSLLLPDFLSMDHVASICRRSQSSAEQDQSCQEIPPTTFWHCNPYSALKLWQYSVLFSKKKTLLLRQPNASQECNQRYVVIRNTSCSKYANRYFPYWKIMFLSSIL